jgi:hypothetical protein
MDRLGGRVSPPNAFCQQFFRLELMAAHGMQSTHLIPRRFPHGLNTARLNIAGGSK